MGRNEKNYQHTFVDDKKTSKKAISEIQCGIKSKRRISIDCKWIDADSLGRKGEVSILSIATFDHVFVFDVLKLKKTVFEKGVGDILEDGTVQKLMFDCREISDWLWHTYGVRIKGVLDLQILEVLYRRDESPASMMAKHIRRSKKVDDVEKLYKYEKCLKIYLKDEDLVKSKDIKWSLLRPDDWLHASLLSNSLNTQRWHERPLSNKLINHCCVDAHGLFLLYENIRRDDKYLERLAVASERYADRYRFLQERKYNIFETNEYLPLDIISDEGTISFPNGDTPCVKCHRLFPREEFSFTQLRNAVQKCRVCKKVKEQLDRERNAELDEEYVDEFVDEYFVNEHFIDNDYNVSWLL